MGLSWSYYSSASGRFGHTQNHWQRSRELKTLIGKSHNEVQANEVDLTLNCCVYTPAVTCEQMQSIFYWRHIERQAKRYHSIYQCTNSDMCMHIYGHTETTSVPQAEAVLFPPVLYSLMQFVAMAGGSSAESVSLFLPLYGSFPAFYLMYSMCCIYIFFVFHPLPPVPSHTPRTLVSFPCIPIHRVCPLCVHNESHQSALKYSNCVFLIYFGMQQTPKGLFYMVMLAAASPENHLCFISFNCLSLCYTHGTQRDLVEIESSQQSVPFWGRRKTEAILQWFPKWHLSVWVFLLLENNTLFMRCW